MAPEVVKQTAYTSKADIWSLGCLVVEMLTGAHPWANLTQMQAIFRVSLPCLRLDLTRRVADSQLYNAYRLVQAVDRLSLTISRAKPMISSSKLSKSNTALDLQLPNSLLTRSSEKTRICKHRQERPSVKDPVLLDFPPKIPFSPSFYRIYSTLCLVLFLPLSSHVAIFFCFCGSASAFDRLV